MFCKEHDEVDCASCIALNHRTCKTVISIPENVDNLYKNTEIIEIKQKINKTKKTVEDIKKAKDQKAKELKEAYEKEVKSIKTFRKELQTLLDNAEQETIKELKQNFDRIETFIRMEIQEMNNLIDTMNAVSAQLKKAEGNKVQEFVSMKISERVAAKAKNVEKPEKTEESVSFTADQKIKSFLQEIKALGKVSCYNRSITGINDRLYKVKHWRDMYVNLADDSSICSVYCSCLIEEGFLLLTDYNNKRLKRLNLSKEKVTDYLELKAAPLAVCLINKTNAVITLDNNSVQFVTLGKKLTAARALKMGHCCYGVAHKDGKMLFVSDSAYHVYIHDMNGRELQKISTDASGNAIFRDTKHLTVSTSLDRIFVADKYKGVVVLDILGNHLFTLNYPKLSCIYGVCTDGKHRFASGFSSCNIFQIDHDYKLVGELAKSSYPVSVCFDPHKNRLIVTGIPGNFIRVFEME